MIIKFDISVLIYSFFVFFISCHSKAPIVTSGEAEARRRFDNTPPNLTIQSPENNFLLTSNILILSVNATDNILVSGINIKVDGVLSSAVPIISGSNYSFNIPLVGGSHTITAQAFDSANNASVIASISGIVNYSSPNSACNTTVSDGQSIQAAISNSTSGSTICVNDGTYASNITINRSIILKSINPRGAKIIGSGYSTGTCFVIGSNNITIKT